nr:methyltransferase domain-containing protein [Chitinophagaceae bacterium]
EYVYFSSYSSSWLAHSKEYTEKMISRFSFDTKSMVIEVASNDGYLLQYFKENEIPVLGIEPTANTANVAIDKGIETITDFFGVRLAEELSDKSIKADLLIGNNVLAHVPNILDFVGGIRKVLKERGIVTIEFPHVMQLIKNNQFDTIYHEHFSYLSLHTVKQIFESQGLFIFDVDEINTHGGSLRIYATHSANTQQSISLNVQALLAKEYANGINKIDYYSNLQEKALKIKLQLLQFLITQKAQNKKIVAYGAAAKGNTLLNYCGVKNDLVDFVADANPHKRNKFLPASHIPVKDEIELKKAKPDFVLILPWNLRAEITAQLDYIKEWGGKFAVPIPELEIF